MISVLFFVWIIGGLSVIHCQPWFAHDYWNSRCDGKDGYTSYDTGIWMIVPWFLVHTKISTLFVSRNETLILPPKSL